MISSDLAFYWKLALRRLPVMLLMVLVCTGAGLVVAFNLPPTYTTSARLLVEEPQIPDSMVTSTVRTDPGTQLQIIQQKLMTRPNLLDIARRFNVFESMDEMTPDRIVEQMLRDTTINNVAGYNQATSMTISFRARTGQIAADVVNEYVTLVLSANNQFRMSRAENTLDFFTREVERLEDSLNQQSLRIVEFKKANAEALPDDLAYRQGRQTLLQERLGQLQRERVSLTRQRTDIVAIFESTGRIRATEETRLSPEETQLNALKLELEEARAIFSPTNPRIRVLEDKVAQLEASLAGSAKSDASGPQAPATMLDITLAGIDSNLEDLAGQIEDTEAELKMLEESIARTSTNAIILAGLEREYESIQQRYDSAVLNLNQARMGEQIEVSSQGQRISVVDAATVPQAPSGPRRKMIAAMGWAAGLGLAGGFFLLLELLNRKIRRPSELQSRIGITPIAVIPYMESRQERVLQRTRRALVVLVIAIGVPVSLWYIDQRYMPLDVLVEKVISRLGIA